MLLWGFLASILVVSLIILSPLVHLIPLKLKFGDQAVIMFYPVLGFEKLFIRSVEKSQDCWAFVKDTIKNQPNVKFILTNMLNKPTVILLDHSYGKLVI